MAKFVEGVDVRLMNLSERVIITSGIQETTPTIGNEVIVSTVGGANSVEIRVPPPPPLVNVPAVVDNTKRWARLVKV